MNPTQRRLFETSLNHVLKQGKPSIMESTGACLYKGPEGEGCGAAPFITDYVEEMEHKPFEMLVEQFPNSVDPDVKDEIDFVAALQLAHDEAAIPKSKDGKVFLDRYASSMRMIARAAGLSMYETASILRSARNAVEKVTTVAESIDD